MIHAIVFISLLVIFFYVNNFVVFIKEESYINEKLKTLALLKQKGRAKHVLPRN